MSDAAWRRSRRCDSNTCVEVRELGEMVAARDGKDPSGPVLRFSRAGWAAFIAGVRAGVFDRP
ncbi:MAG: DUF397 domain-containing protein [Actinobacteria bacterium]|jgi:hypothetical protein|nr:MAG: DUF397 domain-containing protein [Actinomycetota bacterium]